MRLLQRLPDGDFGLASFHDHPPPYAILSHTWTENQEVTYHELNAGTGRDKTGFDKIRFCGERAAADGLQYFWVDTCCIDKSTSEELNTAINSMFRWYQRASKCYVYLSDVFVPEDVLDDHTFRITKVEAFRRSRWFTRGWTLQELIAPANTEFFSRDGKRLGSKISLEQEIHEITKIPISALRGQSLAKFSIEDRMSWVAPRKTTVKEDKVYCLLGIFGVFLPLIYGEGEAYAMRRLREEIQKQQAGWGTDQASNSCHAVARPETTRPSCVVPFRRDPDFVDRGALLGELQEKCTAPASRVALVGLGGVGKSQLAIEHCYRTTDRSPETWVFWVHADNAARLEQSYRDIADQVQLAGRTDSQANVFELVRDWLRNEKHGKWLLVLDNADDAAILTSLSGSYDQQHLSRYIPPSKNGTVIVTSRSGYAASRLVEDQDMIHVTPMHYTGAQTLLRKKLGGKVDTDSIDELAAALEYMPLALVQAAAYIQKRAPHYSVKQYLEEFRKSDKRKVSLLNQEAGHLRRNDEAKNSIIITWQISFEHIRIIRRSAADLLSLMSFFDRQGIPKALLHSQRVAQTTHRGIWTDDREKIDNDEDDSASEVSIDDGFIDDILTLRDYSFVSETTDPETLEMHSLVQLATQKWLEGRGETEGGRQQFISTLSTAFPTGEYENWEACQGLFPHAVAALRKRPRNEESRKEWARLLYNAAWYALNKGSAEEAETLATASMIARSKLLGAKSEETLDSMTMLGLANNLGGRWEAAEQLFVQVMETRKTKLGVDHLDTVYSMTNLASIYRKQGRWEAAERLEVQVLETSKTKLGADHPDTLISISNLASTYWKQGRWGAAERLEVQVLETSKTKLGPDHPDTLISMSNLASTYWNQGRWEAAERLEVQVLEARKTKLGTDHPDTLTSMANLASTYSNQGRWEAAERLEVQVLETRKTKLGTDHPDTLISMANLASTYRKQGRWEAAEQLEVQALGIRKTKLGTDHPDTLTSMANLASTYSNQGRWEAAERLDLQVLEARKTKLGTDHPNTLSSMANLASTYWNQGRWEAAERLDLQVLEARKTKLGVDHPNTLTSMANLASTYRKQGRWEAAERLEVQVLETSKTKLGPDHPDTLSSMANLASTYRNQGRWGAAERLDLQVLEARKTKLGVDHPNTLASMANLASTYRKQGRWEAAERLEVQVLETSKTKLGTDHPDTLISMANLASTYSNQGRWEAAEQLEVQVLEARKMKLGTDHPDTLTSMANLASTYRNQGRWEAAERLDLQVLEARKTKLGVDHPDTLTSMANLASTYWKQGRWEAAERLEVQVLETSKMKLGTDHPDTLISMGNLASTYRKQGRWEAAEQLEVQVLEARRTRLGTDHPDTLTSMANLASTHRYQERYEAAEQLEVQVLEARKTKLGTDHPDTLTSMANLASTYRKQGRWEAAERLEVQVLETRKTKLGTDHPDTLGSMANLASTWKEQQRNIEAITLMQQCIQLRLRKLGTAHPDTISSIANLASWGI